MRSILLTIASAIAMLTCVQTPAFAQGVPIGVQGSVPVCTHAQLHAGTCQLSQPGYTATITNGNGAAGNACASGAGTGSDQITCRYKTGTGWEEFEPGSGGSGGDLGTTATGSGLTVTNTGGTPASIPAATTSTWGALTDEDKTKLDGIAAGATVGLGANPEPCSAGQVATDLNQSGVLTCSVDDDVPESGDFAAASALEADGSLSSNSVPNAALQDDAVGIPELSATGTASSSTFLRGDNTWATPEGDAFSVDSYGALGDGATNDTAAINLAVDAACDAGGGVVYFPPGMYGVGSTGASRFYSGIQVPCSNVVLLGVPGASVIVPLFTHGGSLLNVCPAFDNSTYGANEDCDSVANIENVRIEGLTFYDEDSSLTCNNYDAGRGCCGSGANSSCSSGHEEETHAIFMSDCDNCSVVGNVIDGLGDEGIVVHGTTGNVVSGNVVTNTPSIRGSAGAGISVDGTGVLVTGNSISAISRDPHADAGACTTLCNNKGAGISIGSGSDITVTDNVLTDIDADYGIQIQSLAAPLTDVVVTGNRVELSSLDTIGCVETPVYPGTPSRCSVAAIGSAGTPTRDRIKIESNDLTGGIVTSDVDNIGSVSIANNAITGDEGVGVQAAGAPLLIDGNTITSFQGSGLFISGLEDDDRTDSVLIANNALLGNNDDATQDQAIMFYAPGSPCGTDGVVPGGVNIIGNTIQGSTTADSLTNAIQVDVCARATVNDNSIDFLSASHSTGSGIQNAAVMVGNRIKSPDLYGIITTISGGLISGNLIEGTGNRGIFANGAHDVTITGNTIHGNVASFAIDASGQRPICLGNISKSDDGSDRTIMCGETAPSGAGCSADGADAGGLCGFNQVCNTGDTSC